MVRVLFTVERETKKAVEVCIHKSWAPAQNKFKWIPKSVCEFEEYVARVNPVTMEPEAYGKRVVAIADWFYYKNLQ